MTAADLPHSEPLVILILRTNLNLNEPCDLPESLLDASHAGGRWTHNPSVVGWTTIGERNLTTLVDGKVQLRRAKPITVGWDQAEQAEGIRLTSDPAFRHCWKPFLGRTVVLAYSLSHKRVTESNNY